MSEQNTIVKPEAGNADASKPDASMGTGRRSVEDILTGGDNQVINSDVTSEGGDASDHPTAETPDTGNESPAESGTPDADKGGQAVEQATDSTAVTPVEAESDTQAESNETGEIEGASERANKRIRQLAADQKRLKEKAKRLEAMVESQGAQAPQPTRTQPKPQPAQPTATTDNPTEFTSQDFRAYRLDLMRRRDAGEAVSQEEIENVAAEEHRAMVREEVRRERTREQQQSAAVNSRKQVMRECVALEEIDPQFAIVDDNGKLVDSPFTKQVAQEMQSSGMAPTIGNTIFKAQQVAMKVLTNRLTLQTAQAQQAQTSAKTVLKQTALSGPSKTRSTVAQAPRQTAFQRYEALLAKAEKGDQAAAAEAMRMEMSGVLMGK